MDRYVKELVLKKFFEGSANAMELRLDLLGTVDEERTISHYRITDMDDEFQVEPEHLVLLCDSVIAGELDPKDLETIGFCMVASDSFHWDTDITGGEIVAQTVFDWSEPRINCPLTKETVGMFRERLLAGKNPFTDADVSR